MKIRPNKMLMKSLTKKYWRETRKSLAQSRQQVIEMAKVTDPQNLKAMLPNLLEIEPIQNQLSKIWGDVGGQFAKDTSKAISRSKKADATATDWTARMRAYAYERSLVKAKARKILSTQEQLINNEIDRIIEQSMAEGLSVANTRNMMVDSLSGWDSALVEMENYQAERIARTECISAGNSGSFEAAKEVEGILKEWLHSGILSKGYRENHVEFQGMGAQDMDFEYAPGLQYPGDPAGDADEVINCRCGILFDTQFN